MAWTVVALVIAIGLLVLAGARRRSLSPVLEAVASRTVAELGKGRFKVTGRVVPIQTSPSRLDGSPCVFLEHAEYRTVGSAIVPLLREIEHVIAAHPFWVDDGTGRVLVDPRHASIDAVTVHEDDGLTAERRLRAGEEVELVASFAPGEAEADGGPYRAAHLAWMPVTDVCGPPRITYRTEKDMLPPPLDDLTAFLRGAGVFLIVLSAFFAYLVWT